MAVGYAAAKHPYTIEFPVTVVDHGPYGGRDQLLKAKIDVMAEDPADALDKVQAAIERLLKEQPGA